jgi:hypothetical protein
VESGQLYRGNLATARFEVRRLKFGDLKPEKTRAVCRSCKARTGQWIRVGSSGEALQHAGVLTATMRCKRSLPRVKAVHIQPNLDHLQLVDYFRKQWAVERLILIITDRAFQHASNELFSALISRSVHASWQTNKNNVMGARWNLFAAGHNLGRGSRNLKGKQAGDPSD